ncbi:hypothetical protein ALC62_15996 [Cyphomyrmex costatus]|uniref:THAP-type domain-containing protein n=1 Tax=Cyphomyrmex costatus TaxID=456900 RepID=A0A151I6T6_9HYME|nr:hypothetical protein ALC62_15996 [Cyphomyrmex costatus]
MPFKCCVPNCNGNYKNVPKVATFSFPKNEICELHFRLSEMERETSHYVESTGKLLTAPLAHPRLIKDAVPSQFPNCPRYMTTNDAPKRLAPETKRMKLEHAMIEQVIERSIETEKLFNEKIGFSSLDELYAKLKERIDLQKWIISRRDNVLGSYPLENFVKICFCIIGLHFDPTSTAIARSHPGRAANARGLAPYSWSSPGIQEAPFAAQLPLRHAAPGTVAHTLAWEVPLCWPPTCPPLSGRTPFATITHHPSRHGSPQPPRTPGVPGCDQMFPPSVFLPRGPIPAFAGQVWASCHSPRGVRTTGTPGVPRPAGPRPATTSRAGVGKKHLIEYHVLTCKCNKTAPL